MLSYLLPSDYIEMHGDGAMIAPILSCALPLMLLYTLPSDYVADQPYMQILAHCYGDGRSAEGKITDTEVFLNCVIASSHTSKSWTNMHRKLIYLRTEVWFHYEIVPMLLNPYSNHDVANDDNNNDNNGNEGGEGASQLWKHLPTVHIADYNLERLIPKDNPMPFAKQLLALPPVSGDNNDDNNDDGRQLHKQFLKGKGGHILLQSISSLSLSSVASEMPNSAYGAYNQNLPITLQQSSPCLIALAELHASAWGNAPLLRRIGDQLSNAGRAYSLQFCNPNKLSYVVPSWECFCNQFISAGGAEKVSGGNSSSSGITNSTATCILEKESVMQLGQL
jgi:hypothetical protein